jgi:hypothetical protein
MRGDLPTPIRRELDADRRAFTRKIGAGYEELLELHIDPAPWMAAVIATLEAVKAAAPEQRREAA